jgi:hypothetical protein
VELTDKQKDLLRANIRDLVSVPETVSPESKRVFDALVASSPVPVKIEETPTSLISGGGYFQFNEKDTPDHIGLHPYFSTTPVPLAHELGHATFRKESPYAKYIQSFPSHVGYSLAIPLAQFAGGAAGYKLKTPLKHLVGPLTALALSAPKLYDEHQAWTRASKLLEEHGASEEDRELLKKVRLKALSTYWASPVAASVGGLGASALSGYMRNLGPQKIQVKTAAESSQLAVLRAYGLEKSAALSPLATRLLTGGTLGGLGGAVVGGATADPGQALSGALKGALGGAVLGTAAGGGYHALRRVPSGVGGAPIPAPTPHAPTPTPHAPTPTPHAPTPQTAAPAAQAAAPKPVAPQTAAPAARAAAPKPVAPQTAAPAPQTAAPAPQTAAPAPQTAAPAPQTAAQPAVKDYNEFLNREYPSGGVASNLQAGMQDLDRAGIIQGKTTRDYKNAQNYLSNLQGLSPAQLREARVEFEGDALGTRIVDHLLSKTAADESSSGNYTKPGLRERIKSQVMSGSDGGKPGQWSARKAQLVAQKYKERGGGYKGGKSEAQKSLSKWTKQEWTTSDGKPAERPGGTTRYLPKDSWKKLSPGERAATNAKKREGSREGRQFVANTEAAAEARKEAMEYVKEAAQLAVLRAYGLEKSAAFSPQTFKYLAGKDPTQTFNHLTTGLGSAFGAATGSTLGGVIGAVRGAYNAEDGFANRLKGGLVGGLKGGVVGTVAGGALGAAGGRFAPKDVRNAMFNMVSSGRTPAEVRTEFLRRAAQDATLFR